MKKATLEIHSLQSRCNTESLLATTMPHARCGLRPRIKPRPGFARGIFCVL
jgi:hypothetical protein